MSFIADVPLKDNGHKHFSWPWNAHLGFTLAERTLHDIYSFC